MANTCVLQMSTNTLNTFSSFAEILKYGIDVTDRLLEAPQIRFLLIA